MHGPSVLGCDVAISEDSIDDPAARVVSPQGEGVRAPPHSTLHPPHQQHPVGG